MRSLITGGAGVLAVCSLEDDDGRGGEEEEEEEAGLRSAYYLHDDSGRTG